MMGLHRLLKGDGSATAVAIILLVPLLAGSGAAQRIELRRGKVRRGGSPTEPRAGSHVATTKQKWVTLLQGGFDRGEADGWELQTGWAVARDSGNFVLRGTGRNIAGKWAQFSTRTDWTDFSLRFRMKIVRHGVRLNYRSSSAGRYFLNLGGRGVFLKKAAPRGTRRDLDSYSAQWKPGTWHHFRIRVVGANTKLYVDGKLRLNTTDSRPLARGSIAFETQKGTHVHVDDVVVAGPPQRSRPPARRDRGQPPATKRPDWITLLQDDFDSGKADASWSLGTGWSVEMDNRDLRNFVLKGVGLGIGREQARLTRRRDWTDFSLRFRMKMLDPGVRLNYRASRSAWYCLGLGDRTAALRKVARREASHEKVTSEHWKLGPWHDFEIRVVGANTKLYVDGKLRLDTTDDRPLARGGIAFETQQNTHVHIDDVVVVGAPPPTELKWENVRGPMGGLV